MCDVRGSATSSRAASDAVEIRQAQVHQDDVGQMLGREARSPSAAVAASSVPKLGRGGARLERASGSDRCRPRSGRAGGTTSPAYSPPVPIRIVLAEDHYLVREGVRRLLDAQPGFEVAAVCGDLDSLLEAVDREAPDVVVTDVRMPPGHSDEGIQAARRLRETNPGLGVVVLSQYADPTYALALLDTGSAGRAYVLKERVARSRPAPRPPSERSRSEARSSTRRWWKVWWRTGRARRRRRSSS